MGSGSRQHDRERPLAPSGTWGEGLAASYRMAPAASPFLVVILFLQEIPIRIARTVKNFQALPFIVGENPHINRIYTSFWGVAVSTVVT